MGKCPVDLKDKLLDAFHALINDLLKIWLTLYSSDVPSDRRKYQNSNELKPNAEQFFSITLSNYISISNCSGSCSHEIEGVDID